VVIRAGRRRPHPRHWQDLAKLVGIQGDGSFTSLTFVHSGNCPLQRHRVCENGRGLCQAGVGRASRPALSTFGWSAGLRRMPRLEFSPGPECRRTDWPPPTHSGKRPLPASHWKLPRLV